MFKKKTFLFITILLILTARVLLHVIPNYPTYIVPKQISSKNYNSKFLYYSSIGNQRFISTLLYAFTMLEADTTHYLNQDKNNWLYLRFNSVLDLDPKFYHAALYGGMYLAIIKNDPHNGLGILQSGLKHYPDDYWLNYFTGFIYYFDLKQLDRALEHYKKIVSHPLTEKNPLVRRIYLNLLNKSGLLNNDESLNQLLNEINSDDALKGFIKEYIKKAPKKSGPEKN